MSDLYWLGVLGNLHGLGAGIAVISFLAMIFFVVYTCYYYFGWLR
jgi:hypothetical protein